MTFYILYSRNTFYKLMLNKKPFLVAEISANHAGKLKIAKKLIFEAKKYGADAVKLQTFEADDMVIKSKTKKYFINSGEWKGKFLWDLYNQAETPFVWHKKLFSYSKKIGIRCFSTPFSIRAVELLESLGCPFYKIASFEMNDLDLIKRVAQTKKEIIISTGMASLKEIETSYNVAKKNGAKKITLLYCVSKYPSDNKDFNLENIKILKDKFKCKIGLSDHSIDDDVAKLAAYLGADLFEKHICLKKNLGLDSKFSITTKEIPRYKKAIIKGFELRGEKFFYRNKSEIKNKMYRRSIYVVNDIKKGEKFTNKNLRKLRPAFGLDMKLFSKILGKKSKKNLKKNTALKKGDI